MRRSHLINTAIVAALGALCFAAPARALVINATLPSSAANPATNADPATITIA